MTTPLRPILRHLSSLSQSSLHYLPPTSAKEENMTEIPRLPASHHLSTGWRGGAAGVKYFLVVEYGKELLLPPESRKRRECDESEKGGSLLILLQPTAHQQLVHLLTPLHLPSPLGLSLHLILPSTTSGPTPTPKLTDSIWSTILGAFLVPSPGSSQTSDAFGGLPIVARVQLKVDPTQARWYDAWKMNPDDGTVGRWVDLERVRKDYQSASSAPPPSPIQPDTTHLFSDSQQVAIFSQPTEPPSPMPDTAPGQVIDDTVQVPALPQPLEVQSAPPTASSFGYTSSIPYSPNLSSPATAALATQPFLQELQAALDSQHMTTLSRRSPGLTISIPQRPPWADLDTALYSQATSWGPPSIEPDWSPADPLGPKDWVRTPDLGERCSFSESDNTLDKQHSHEHEGDRHGTGAFLPQREVTSTPSQWVWPYQHTPPLPEPETLNNFPRHIDAHHSQAALATAESNAKADDHHGSGAFLPNQPTTPTPSPWVWPYRPLIPMPEPETLKAFPRELDAHHRHSLIELDSPSTDYHDPAALPNVSSDLDLKQAIKLEATGDIDPIGDEHEVPDSGRTFSYSIPDEPFPTTSTPLAMVPVDDRRDFIEFSPASANFDFTLSPISPMELQPYTEHHALGFSRLPLPPPPPVPTLAQLQAMTDDMRGRPRAAPLGPRALPGSGHPGGPSSLSGKGTTLEDIEEVDSPAPSPAADNISENRLTYNEEVLSETEVNVPSSPVPQRASIPSLPSPRDRRSAGVLSAAPFVAPRPAATPVSEQRSPSPPPFSSLGHLQPAPVATSQQSAPESNLRRSVFRSNAHTSRPAPPPAPKHQISSISLPTRARESTLSLASTLSAADSTASKTPKRPFKRLSQSLGSIGSFCEAPSADQSLGGLNSRAMSLKGSSMYGENGCPDLQIYPPVRHRPLSVKIKVYQVDYPIIELYAPLVHSPPRSIPILPALQLYPAMCIYSSKVAKTSGPVKVTLISYVYPEMILYPAIQKSSHRHIDKRLIAVTLTPTEYPSLVIYPVTQRSRTPALIPVTLAASPYPDLVIYPPVQSKRIFKVTLTPIVYPSLMIYPPGVSVTLSESRKVRSIKVLLRPFVYPEIVIYPASTKVQLSSYVYPDLVIYPPKERSIDKYDARRWHPAFGGYTQDTLPIFDQVVAAGSDTRLVHPAWVGRWHVKRQRKSHAELVDEAMRERQHTQYSLDPGEHNGRDREEEIMLNKPAVERRSSNHLLIRARNQNAALKASLERIDTSLQGRKAVRPAHSRDPSNISLASATSATSSGSAEAIHLQTPLSPSLSETSTRLSTSRKFPPAKPAPTTALPPLPALPTLPVTHTYHPRTKGPDETSVSTLYGQNGTGEMGAIAGAISPPALTPPSTGSRTPTRGRSSTLVAERMKAFLDNQISPPLPASATNPRGIRSSTISTQSPPAFTTPGALEANSRQGEGSGRSSEAKKVGRLSSVAMRTWT